MAPKKAAKKTARKKPSAGQAKANTAPSNPASQGSSTSVESQDHWVVLIYMAATSPELSAIMESDLAEIAARVRLLKEGALRIHALMDTPDGKYAIQRTIHGPEDRLIVRANEGDEETLGRKGSLLQQFIDWRFKKYRASSQKTCSRTLLVLWGHSQGVAAALSQPGSPAYAMVGQGGFGFNEISGDSLSLPQIRRAIAAGLEGHPSARIEVLSFDSCFMGAAEVSAEFQGREPVSGTQESQPRSWTREPESQESEADKAADKPARVDYVVASQTAVLLDGLDYARLVDVFIEADDPGSVDPLTVGRRLVEQASSTSHSPVSLSLLHTKEPDPYEVFREAFDRLVQQLGDILDTAAERPIENLPVHVRAQRATQPQGRQKDPGINRAEWLRIREAFESATWHRVRQFVDVGDLCRRLANNSRVKDLRLAAIDVLASLALPSKGKEAAALVIDVRSQQPLLLSGVSLYCPWLFPTPEEVRAGAWNAVVDLFEYATGLWFNRGVNSWGGFLFNARHLLEESRQRAINTEIADLRTAAEDARPSPIDPVADAAPRVRGGGPKTGGGDGFTVAEPMSAVRASGQGPLTLRDLTADRAAAQGLLDRVPVSFDPLKP